MVFWKKKKKKGRYGYNNIVQIPSKLTILFRYVSVHLCQYSQLHIYIGVTVVTYTLFGKKKKVKQKM